MKINLFKRKNFLTAEEKKQKNKERLLLALSGIMMGLSFPPVPAPVLMFAGLVPFFYAIEKREHLIDLNRAAYIMAFFFSVTSVYWVGAWQVANDPFLMIAGALLLFVNPVFFLIPTTIYYFAKKFLKPEIALLLFPFFWVTYEYVYMLTDASFPWLTLGNGLSHFNYFIQIADIVGAMGLSLIVVYINLFLYQAIRYYKTAKAKSTVFVAAAVIMFLIPVVYGAIRVNTYKVSGRKVKVGLIQPNLDPYEKWAGGSLVDILEEYTTLSKQAVNNGAEMLIWPETALPVYLFGGNYPGTVSRIYDFLRTNNVQLLTGMPDLIYYEGDNYPSDAKVNKIGTFHYATYNAVLLLNPYSGEIQRYGKMKLVPFGERVPFVDALPFLGSFIQWGVGISGWNVGRDTVNFNVSTFKPVQTEQVAEHVTKSSAAVNKSFKVNALICYESIYPTFIANFTQKGSEMIAVVTNDSWYGNSSGPYQHKEISVLRAVENRRSVVRAANGGISCYINPLGVTECATGMFTKGYLNANVELENRMTFFTRHPLVIPILASAISLWVIGFSILLKIKNKFYKNREV